VEVEDDVRETRTDAASKVEEKVGDVAEVVFDVIAEDPEEEHVTRDVQEAAVEEHAGENGEKGGFQASVAVEGQANVVGDGGIGEFEDLLLVSGECEFVEEDDDVRQNEKSIDDGVGAARVQVFDRDEHALAWVVQAFVSRFAFEHNLA
jgi:hypothetical protein